MRFCVCFAQFKLLFSNLWRPEYVGLKENTLSSNSESKTLSSGVEKSSSVSGTKTATRFYERNHSLCTKINSTGLLPPVWKCSKAALCCKPDILASRLMGTERACAGLTVNHFQPLCLLAPRPVNSEHSTLGYMSCHASPARQASIKCWIYCICVGQLLQHSSCLGHYWFFCAVSIYPTVLCHPNHVTSVRLSRLISGGCISTFRIYP